MDYRHEGMPRWASDKGMKPNTQALYGNIERHPTEKMGASVFADQERRNLQRISVQYGSAAAMQTVIERNIFAQTKRLGLHSNMHGVQDDMGRYYEITEADLYNDPRENPNLEQEPINSRVLKVYGL